MSFNTAPGRSEYTASAAQTIFTFPFKIFNTSDVKVYLTPVGQTADDTVDILIEITDYTVTINGDNGGDVTLTSGTTLNDSITLVRSLPITRDTEYQHAGDLTAEALNSDQEYQTYLTLDASVDFERSLKIPSSVQGFDTEIPSPVANKLLVLNSAADGFDLLDTSSTGFFNDAFIVESVVAMIGVDPNLYGSVIAKGYYVANDGGGGLFNYDATQSAVNNGGTIINGWIRQYNGELKSKWFDTFTNALAMGEALDIEDSVISITSPLTAPSFGVDIISSKGGSITGYNGLGITVASGVLHLDGVLFSGFYDGTNDNKTNYATTVFRIPNGSAIDSIKVKNTSVDSCRAFIVATLSDADDFNPAPTTTIGNIEVHDSSFSNIPISLSFRCVVHKSIFASNNFEDLIGAGREVVGIAVFLDAQPFGTLTSDDTANVQCIGNKFKTIINKTTTGDSTAGNNYETHAIIVSGYNVVIDGNMVEDCTGNVYDVEGIYTKARYVTMTNNVMIDSGGLQGSLTIKGTSDDASAPPASPYGDRYIMANNIVEYTRDSYDNFGTVVDLQLLGLYVEATNNVLINNNIIRGANIQGIILNGITGSYNRGIVLSNNLFENFKGDRIISTRGAFHDLVIDGNIAEDILSDTKQVSFYVLDGAVLNRGIANKGVTVTNNRFRVGDKTTNDTGLALDFIVVNTTGYTVDDLNISNNTIDVHSATALARCFYFTGVAFEANGVVIENNIFVGIYNSNIFVMGSTPKSIRCDIIFDSSANNATIYPIQIKPQDDTASTQIIQCAMKGTTTLGSQYSYGVRNVHTAAGTTTDDGTLHEPLLGSLNIATFAQADISASTGIRTKLSANTADGDVTFTTNYKFVIK